MPGFAYKWDSSRWLHEVFGDVTEYCSSALLYILSHNALYSNRSRLRCLGGLRHFHLGHLYQLNLNQQSVCSFRNASVQWTRPWISLIRPATWLLKCSFAYPQCKYSDVSAVPKKRTRPSSARKKIEYFLSVTALNRRLLTYAMFCFKDPDASYDVNDRDPDPQPRYTQLNDNR